MMIWKLCCSPKTIVIEASLQDLGWSFNLKPKETQVVASGGPLPTEVVDKCKERN